MTKKEILQKWTNGPMTWKAFQECFHKEEEKPNYMEEVVAAYYALSPAERAATNFQTYMKREVEHQITTEKFNRLVAMVCSHDLNSNSSQREKLIIAMFNDEIEGPDNFSLEPALLAANKFFAMNNTSKYLWDITDKGIDRVLRNELQEAYNTLKESVGEFIDFKDASLEEECIEVREFIMETPEYAWALKVCTDLDFLVSSYNNGEPTTCFK